MSVPLDDVPDPVGLEVFVEPGTNLDELASRLLDVVYEVSGVQGVGVDKRWLRAIDAERAR